MLRSKKLRLGVAVITIAATLAAGSSYVSAHNDQENNNSKAGRWVTGDLHTHTFLTDGSNTETDVASNAFEKFGVDWFANSEHGGYSQRDPQGNTLSSPITRWITLKYMSYPIVKSLRTLYPSKKLIQAVEWNVPTHEHASVGIVEDAPLSVSDFEYIFDASDKDTSRAAEGLIKTNKTHQDAVAGAAWLQANYPNSSYFLPNHPSRQLKYSIADIRDFNNAAPDVCFGFEGIPGHQKEATRGGYGNSNPLAQTYGGADLMIAKVGGFWDALLGEGRHFWTFANSDFHNVNGDFWPGEYEKNYTLVNGEGYDSLIDGLRSGNEFAVEGDLINALDFDIKSRNKTATMGQELTVNGKGNLQITIRFKSPKVNNNGDKVAVDHIDLIAGDVTAKAAPGSAEYAKDTNDTTKVIATFTKKDWEREDGWNVIRFNLKNVENNKYFRLRGTNLGKNIANETDADGNPLSDSLMGANNPDKAYDDLWFYSNPVFVSAK